MYTIQIGILYTYMLINITFNHLELLILVIIIVYKRTFNILLFNLQ